MLPSRGQQPLPEPFMVPAKGRVIQMVHRIARSTVNRAAKGMGAVPQTELHFGRQAANVALAAGHWMVLSRFAFASAITRRERLIESEKRGAI